MELSGKRALVTGASRGIGRSIAEALVAEGIQVFGTSRTPEDVDWPAGVTGIELDVSSPDSVERGWAASNLDKVVFDIVVNNAGAGAFGAFHEKDFAQWEAQIGTLLLGPMKIAQLAIARWSLGKAGVLVNVSSLAVEYPIPYMSGYNVAKAGLAAFSESLQLEYCADKVRLLELRLGDMDTGFNDRVSGKPMGDRQERVWAAMCRHVGEGPAPEKAAEVLLKYLKSDKGGVVRFGGFFQSIVASLFARMVSHRVKRAANLSYYKVGRDR